MPQPSINHILSEYTSWGFCSRPQLVRPLIGGLTNRSYLIANNDGQYVVRVFAENTEQLDINRETEFTIGSLVAEHGLAAGPEYLSADRGYSVSRYIDGVLLKDAAITLAEKMQLVGSTLRRLHDVKTNLALPVLDVVAKAEAYWRSITCRPELQKFLPYKAILQQMFGKLARAEVLCLCHHDLVMENMIVSDNGLQLIDWEYAALGSPYFDLASAALNLRLEAEGEDMLVAAYDGVVDRARYDEAKLQVLYLEWLWWMLQGECDTRLQSRLAKFYLG